MTLRILTVTAEAFPLAKTGGLGDAVSGLCEALGNLDSQVTIMLPGYRGVIQKLVQTREVACFGSLPGGTARLFAGKCPQLSLDVLVLENDALFDREDLYCDADGVAYRDNAIRYASLSMAAALVADGRGGVPRPHIVHAHDWHAALTPLYMKQMAVKGLKTLLTLHNLAFQGAFPLEDAAGLGIDPRYCTSDGAECWGQLNFLKAGIQFADRISVVSHNYAREILTPQFGCGLEGALVARGTDLVSIPNGISHEYWNPKSDVYLGEDCFHSGNLANKVRCKIELQRRFDLTQGAGLTVMAMGSRLTEQKMADVAVQAIPAALESHPMLQVCVIGRGQKEIEVELKRIARHYPGRCGVVIGYDEENAHRLHAGADILLHGSRFEPFGLTPLYAMRYGTIPIGSRVGGMADTLRDPGCHLPMQAMCDATGILFEGDRAADMNAAIDRAMSLRLEPELWSAMQYNAMNADFSWTTIAPTYIRSYQALCDRTLPEEAKIRPQPELAPTMSSQESTAVDLPSTLNATKAKGGRVRSRMPRRARSDVLSFPDSASVA